MSDRLMSITFLMGLFKHVCLTLRSNPPFVVEFISFQELRYHLRACVSRWNHESVRKYTSYTNQECVLYCTVMTLPDFFATDKAEWVGKERLRWAKLFDVPMAKEMPPGFPPNTIQVSKTSTFRIDANPVYRSRGY